MVLPISYLPVLWDAVQLANAVHQTHPPQPLRPLWASRAPGTQHTLLCYKTCCMRQQLRCSRHGRGSVTGLPCGAHRHGVHGTVQQSKQETEPDTKTENADEQPAEEMLTRPVLQQI